ncbi:unnamed protein product [Haemonchus placei]|uniref:CCHC-type domain-containing protein n=1 Tax=Haemonchus placei TaxID=6290 RepID=A0A0N4VUF4_HAEPC|nr:unnamed protein product [Haemonchus placei]
MVATVIPDGLLPRTVPFTGSREDPIQFSLWLRRLKDVMRMRSTTWTTQPKAYFLTGYLDGVAREKLEELTDERDDHVVVVEHLKRTFEGPPRYTARQALASCQQQISESASTFANCYFWCGPLWLTPPRPPLLRQARQPNYVRASGSESADGEAATQGSSSGRLMRPSLGPRTVEQTGKNPIRSRSPVKCFDCGEVGHLSRQCPSPRNSQGDTGKPTARSSPRGHGFSRLPRNYASPSRYDRDRELPQAREQVNALSISLQENKSALEKTDARVTALVRRNEELARSTYGHVPSSSFSLPMPQVNLLLPLSILLCASFSEALTTPAWLCPHSPTDALARIPTHYNCSQVILPSDGPPRPFLPIFTVLIRNGAIR